MAVDDQGHRPDAGVHSGRKLLGARVEPGHRALRRPQPPARRRGIDRPRLGQEPDGHRGRRGRVDGHARGVQARHRLRQVAEHDHGVPGRQGQAQAVIALPDLGRVGGGARSRDARAVVDGDRPRAHVRQRGRRPGESNAQHRRGQRGPPAAQRPCPVHPLGHTHRAHPAAHANAGDTPEGRGTSRSGPTLGVVPRAANRYKPRGARSGSVCHLGFCAQTPRAGPLRRPPGPL